jgi:hypothetical protein
VASDIVKQRKKIKLSSIIGEMPSRREIKELFGKDVINSNAPKNIEQILLFGVWLDRYLGSEK